MGKWQLTSNGNKGMIRSAWQSTNGNTRFRCRDCGRWISYYNITKTFDGCYHCSGEQD